MISREKEKKVEEFQSPTNSKCFELWRMFLTENPPSGFLYIYIYIYRNCQKEQRATDLQILQFSLKVSVSPPHFLVFRMRFDFLYGLRICEWIFHDSFSSYVNFGFTFLVSSTRFSQFFSLPKQTESQVLPPSLKFEAMSLH